MIDIIRRVNHTLLSKVTDDNGNSLITLAVMNGHLEMVNLLCRFGINPNFQNKDGNTPLHFAVAMNMSNC